MKKTQLYNKHIELGAKIVPFAGYEMPVSYKGVKIEHLAVRENLGVFDVSHMGEFVVKGKDATELLQWICSNDIAKMKNFQCQYNCMPNDKGGIVDDLIVYKWDDNEYNLVVNAANIDKDLTWINQQIEEKEFDVQIDNISEQLSLIAVQGPKAKEVLQTLTELPLDNIKYYWFSAGTIAGLEDVVISNTGYTGSGGFELYVWNKDAEKLWDTILQAGAKHHIEPCGLAARDTLRLEKGFCLYGNDIDDTTSPIEAGLSWITKFTKEFVNADYHKKLKEGELTKKLVGIEMIDKGIPRQGYELFNEQGEKVGVVTSGTQAPSLNKAIGMAYMAIDFTTIGQELLLAVRNKHLKVKIVSLPFLK